MHDQENISNVTSQWQHNQLQGMAGPAGAAAVMGAFALKDHMQRQSMQDDALLNQQQIMNKQLFIQNCLLQGWSMQDINEEIAAGEALYAARPQPADPFPWGSVAILVGLGLLVLFIIFGIGSPS